MNLVVVDDSLSVGDTDESHGLSVSIFRPELALFPDVRAEDEIVQFRHMRIQVFQNVLQAISTNWSAFTVYARDESGQWIARPDRPIEVEERATLDRIAARTGHTAATVRSSPKKPQLNRKVLTIDLIRPDLYFDLVAQIVRILPPSRPSQACLLLADYTLNPEIQTNPVSFNLSSNLEHRLLLTTLWDNFAEQSSRLREGQIIRIVNLRSKIIHLPREDDHSSGGLVGILHGDHSNSEKIFVQSNSTVEASTILERKRNLLGQDHISPISSPPRPPSPIPSPLVPSKLTFSPAKSQPLTCILEFSPPPILLILVAILHDDVQVVAIRTVLNCSQVPAKFAIKGRVVGHYPSTVSTFSRPFCNKCAASLSTKSQVCPHCKDTLVWAFVFGLEITDGVDTIKVIVAHQEAVRFLNGLLPTDLSVDKTSQEYVSNNLAALVRHPIPSTFCIKSCTMANETRYFLFDTLLALK